MKWEPVAAMVLLLALGFWLVYAPSTPHALRPGADVQKFAIAGMRGELEVVREPDGTCSFRLLFRSAPPSRVLDEATFRSVFGDRAFERAVATAGNGLFRALNITSWTGVAWVAIGFVGQLVFAGRTFVQWVASERQKRSVIPDIYWWMSLVGAVMLFVYFVWRQDLIAVLGQSSGVVIYARNLRLVFKQRRRESRAAARPS